MGIESKFIWMDGELVPFEKATVHFLTPALHYGAGVFEGIRAYATKRGSAIFRAQEHAQRLVDSARVLGFEDLPWDSGILVKAFRDVVRANAFGDCYIRPLIYASAGCGNLSLVGAKASLGVAAWDMGDFLGPAAREAGIRACVSSFTRHHPNVMMTKAKSIGNYVNSILAKTESVRLGFDEAIMLDPQGYVAECTGENLFLVKGGKLRTTPLAAVLEGITRASLVAIAGDLGYSVEEGPISRDQLYVADEVFVCGTAAEVVALREIDHRAIGSGRMGPVARALQEAYHATVRGDGPRSAAWLTPVD
jgi:branched-chain amino acid aminotransferase